MASTEYLTVPQAMKIVQEKGFGATKPTIIPWIEKYQIGKKIGGRWYVSKRRLHLILEGKEWKLLQEIEKEKQR